jgi:hypothetical protein
VRRTRFVACLAGLLGLGTLVSGLADGLPESARAILSILVWLGLPSFLLSGRMPAAPALRLPLSVLAWLSVMALWTTGFVVAGASFRAFALATTWGVLCLYAGACAWQLRRRGRGRAPAAEQPWWWLVAACALFAAANLPPLAVGEDGLDHAGYVRRVLTDNALRPSGVLVVPAGGTAWPDPRKGALHPVIALVSWTGSADPTVVWRWLSVLTFPAAVVAVLAFNTAFLSSRGARIAAAVLVIVTFEGNTFRFAQASTRGESIAALWCWVLAAMAVGGAPRRAHTAWWVLLAAGGVLVHLGVAWHVAILIATVAALGGVWGMGARERTAVCAALAAGVAAALVLRRGDLAGASNLLHAHTQGVMFVTGSWFVASPMEILRLHGIIFLGGLACIPFLPVRSRRDARVILALSAVPLLVSFLPPVTTWLCRHGSYMVFRSLLQVPALAAIALAGEVVARGVRARDRRTLWFGVPALALWCFVFARPVPRALVSDARARQEAPGGAVPRELVRLAQSLPNGSVVLSDPATSYVLSAYTSLRFVAVHEQHGNPRDPLALERLQAVRDGLSPYVMPEVAAAACRRFGVNYVLVNAAAPRDASTFFSVWSPALYPAAIARMTSMEPALALVARTATASLYRFDARAAVGRAWAAQDRPVVTCVPPAGVCAVDAPADAYRVTALAVHPAAVLPGDTLTVTLGYRRDAPKPFALPSLLHLRFDHESISTRGEWPGEKQWRRVRERRAGLRARFREDVRPGRGVYLPDLWPVGFDLCEAFRVVVPRNATLGAYRVEVAVEPETQVPNFHVRDLLYNHDHYSGLSCATFTVGDRVVSEGVRP